MGCCRRRTCWPPVAKLCDFYNHEGKLFRIESCTEWNDPFCDPEDRKIEWEFSLNENLIYVLPFAALDTPIAIGNDSSYNCLKLPNGAADLFSFLEDLGFNFKEGDVLKLQINAINCDKKQSIYPSNIIEVAKPICQNPWLTLDGEVFLTMENECWQHF
jgi:hypothetical protein